MKRRAFNFLALASLLLFVLSSAAWIRSYMAYDFLTFIYDSTGAPRVLRQVFELRSTDGGVELGYYHSPDFGVPDKAAPHLIYESEPPRDYPWCYETNLRCLTWHSLGLQLVAGKTGLLQPPTVWVCYFIFPYLFLNGLFATLGFWTLYMIRRKTWMSSTCSACGYDLRATPHRCPECGSVPAARIS